MSKQKADIVARLLYLRTGRTPNWYDDSTRWLDGEALAAMRRGESHAE